MVAPVFGAGCDGCFLWSPSLAFWVLLRRMSDNGLSSSNDTPVTRSTYSKSSIAILATGTAIFTPFSLCK